MKKTGLVYHWHRLVNAIGSLLRNIHCRFQRFCRGYSWVDVCGMDEWFVRTATPMLKEMLDTHTGHPAEMTAEEWTAVLAEMIDCLKYMDRDAVYEELYGSDGEIASEQYAILEQKIEDKKNRFFELFSKWFYCLWD